MKKHILLITLLFFTIQSFSQEEESKLGWNTDGIITFLFNQSAFSNWVAGGENNVAGNLNVNYNFNYTAENHTWDNRILASYGITKSKNSPFTKKTDDRLEFNSLYGKQASKNWFYSAFLNFKTQFTKGYNYSKDENGKEIRDEYTNFLSPAYLTFGPGMLWKKSDNFKINLAPATAKFTFVDDYFTTTPNYVDGDYFGIDEGENSRFELGFNASMFAKFNLFENVSMENILNLYSNYLEDPENVDLDYTMNMVMSINKFLSANIIFQTIYDDNAYEGFQVREVFGLGINYKF